MVETSSLLIVRCRLRPCWPPARLGPRQLVGPLALPTATTSACVSRSEPSAAIGCPWDSRSSTVSSWPRSAAVTIASAISLRASRLLSSGVLFMTISLRRAAGFHPAHCGYGNPRRSVPGSGLGSGFHRRILCVDRPTGPSRQAAIPGRQDLAYHQRRGRREHCGATGPK
jgi:hypothetical protein